MTDDAVIYDQVTLDGATLTAEHVASIAGGAKLSLAPAAIERMNASAEWYLSQHPGGLLRAKWHWLGGTPPEDSLERIQGFLFGHCAAVGKALDGGVVRAMIALRLNQLAVGASAIRPVVVQRVIELLNDGYLPVVPSEGSVGAAGSAQMAHAIRALCGFGGPVRYQGKTVDATELPALDVRPNEKETLSLINGPALAVTLAALNVAKAESLLRTAVSAAAMSFEVVRADLGCLAPSAMAARLHPGGIEVARMLRALLDGSSLCTLERQPDPFSIRCTPAVLGAAWDSFIQIKTVVERELNGACDNPLIFPGEGVFEVGNFHAAPIAMAMDQLKIALTQVSGLSERRTFRLTHGDLSGLPSFLVHGSGLNSGLMLAQYTAASLTSEAKVRSHPSSVDSVPIVQHHEDHVPMAPQASQSARAICEILSDVLAIELICAAQGIDLRLDDGDAPAPRTAELHQAVRRLVPRWVDDRVLHPDLRTMGRAVRDGQFVS